MDGNYVRRRTILRSIGSALATAQLTQPVAAQSTGTKWVTDGYDRLNSGTNPQTSGVRTGVSKEWRFSADTEFVSSPAVVGDTVYLNGTGGQAYAVPPSGDVQIYTLDSEGRNSTKQVPRPARSITSAPTVIDGIMYVGTLGGSVFAVDIANASQLWAFQTRTSVRSSPTVVDGTVYIGSTDGTVYAIDAVDGAEQWRYASGAPIVSTPAVTEGSVYVTGSDGTVTKLAAGTGERQWKLTVGERAHASPVVGAGGVYAVSADGTVAAVRADGSKTWSKSLGAPVTGTPSLGSGTIRVGVHGGTVVALRTDTGEQAWRTSVTGDVIGDVTATERMVYAGTSGGQVVGLDAAGGQTQWSFDAGAPVAGPVVIAGGMAYFGTRSGEVYALAEPSGLSAMAATSLRRARAFINENTGAVVGMGAGGAVVAGGYAGIRRLRSPSDDASATDGDSIVTSDGVTGGDADPISDDGPAAELQAMPDLSSVSFDEFEIEDTIGSGGNADVQRATIELAGATHTVALKTPRMSEYETVDTSFFEEFVEEAQVWDDIDDHQNIVSVLAWGDRPHPWIALEYMADGNLASRVSQLEPEAAFVHLEEIAEAVHHAHRHGITHTDLKPENILFTSRAGRRVAKVADWGLANVLLEHSTSVRGLTPEYSAPEQIDAEAYGGTDDRTDIYQLGVVAYELLTGDVPFDRQTQAATINAILSESPVPPTQRESSLPDRLDAIFETALAKDKEERFETVLHFRDALRHVYHDQNI